MSYNPPCNLSGPLHKLHYDTAHANHIEQLSPLRKQYIAFGEASAYDKMKPSNGQIDHDGIDFARLSYSFQGYALHVVSFRALMGHQSKP